MTDLTNAVVLVTGANGGLGAEFVRQALERGATKVYATARNPRTWDDERIVPSPSTSRARRASTPQPVPPPTRRSS